LELLCQHKDILCGSKPPQAMAGYPNEASKDDKPEAAPVPAGSVPAEKTADELAKMSKEERTAYHMARRAAPKAAAGVKGAAGAKAAPLTKAERRAVQDAQRKVKEDKANTGKDEDELFNELKLQGLSEDQARAVFLEMKNDAPKAADDDEDEDEEIDDLLGAVRVWMREQPDGEIPDDAIRDFNMKVRFQGHVDTTPPDHLAALLNVLVTEACTTCDLTAAKINPSTVSKALTPLAERWANMLRGLYGKTAELDVVEAITTLLKATTEAVAATGAPQQGQDCAVVGCLMALRNIDDLVEDEDLLVGCKAVEERSGVLDKFIDFLEDAIAEDDDEDDDDEDEK